MAPLPFEFYEFLRKLQNANGERKAKGKSERERESERQWQPTTKCEQKRENRNSKYNKIIIIKVKNPFYTPNNEGD